MPWRPKDEEGENHGNPRAAEEDSCAVAQRNPFKHFKIGYILKESSFSAINIVFKISCPQVNPHIPALKNYGILNKTTKVFCNGVQGGGIDAKCKKHTMSLNEYDYIC